MNARIRGTALKPRTLSWSRTVPRELVHRASLAEVLLTDVLRIDEKRFTAAASWPRSHPTFPLDGPAVHHPLMAVETLRQLGIYIPLRYFRVPVNTKLLITDLFFGVEPGAQPRVCHGATRVTCRAVVDGLRTDTRGAATGLRLRVEFLANGTVFARAGGGARFLSPGRYADVRGETSGGWPPPTPAGLLRPDPASLGVSHSRDVLVGLTGSRGHGGDGGPEKRHRRGGPLRAGAVDGRDVVVDAADPWHPFFFDHPTDHVPGIVLLEAGRQAAALASGGALLRLAGARLSAPRFTEFAPAARVTCVRHDGTCVVRFGQNGQCPAFGVLSFHSLSRA
ncbi:A-factor biosynthesis protein [Streptomyces sp. SID486]|uniref:ScbA/BarX family gamma-butyrolactone biosynthesis protein n=1 Tax=Streptomyces sp. SID486 TaxID=2690264 RepID=UPI0013708CBE|nr:ScbA/BarX family gamma-butyrolactone biosynthesis protein [Streptomyces sp. SID486]MYX96860.1 A-factor biosynthesis protein [Streptomyces sp. SID486]